MSVTFPSTPGIAGGTGVNLKSVGNVAVYDDQFRTLFDGAETMKATIKESAKLMTHPTETGVQITDHRVIEQTEIELDMLLHSGNYRNTYQQIKQAFTAGTLITVTTKTDTYQNMLIAGLPHEETADYYDAIPLHLKLTEAKFITPQYEAAPITDPANKSDGKAKNRGQQQPGDANAEQEKKGSTVWDIVFK